MYSKISVRIPQVPGKITSIKKGKATYILYEYDRVYKPEKKYTIAQRAIFGKVTERKLPEVFSECNSTRRIARSIQKLLS